MDYAGLGALIGGFLIIFLVIIIVLYVLIAWGLYNIHKKLGEPNPWTAWVPFVSIYSMVRCAGKENIWILWIIIASIVSNIGSYSDNAILGIIGLIGLIASLVLWIKIYHSISVRTGRGVGTTVGLLFIPFIMFPIVGSSFQPKKDEKTEGEMGNNTIGNNPEDNKPKDNLNEL